MNADLNDAEIQQRLGALSEAPMLPDIVTNVLRLTKDPTSAIDDLVEEVHKDPGLSAKILKIANSSYYGMSQHVGSVKLAMVILGLNEVKNIVIGIAVLETLSRGGGRLMLDKMGFWDHSVICGGVTTKLARSFGLRFDGEDFIAGLLHDLGKTMIVQNMPEKYKEVFAAVDREGVPLHEAELGTFGFDHAHAGAFVASRWKFPEELIDAIGNHHGDAERLNGTKDPSLAAITRLGNELTVVLEAEPDEERTAGLLDDLAWEVLSSAKPQLQVDNRDKVVREIEKEVRSGENLRLF